MSADPTVARDRTANYLVCGLMDQIHLAEELTDGKLTTAELLEAVIRRLEFRRG